MPARRLTAQIAIWYKIVPTFVSGHLYGIHSRIAALVVSGPSASTPSFSITHTGGRDSPPLYKAPNSSGPEQSMACLSSQRNCPCCPQSSPKALAAAYRVQVRDELHDCCL